jgi:scyllo-inositol 2-dehydrogenase (NADP+)
VINTAIVGFGKSAKTFHLPFLKELGKFSIKAFVSSQKNAIEKEYPDARVYSSVDELAADKTIKLVIITSPTFMHFEQAKILLKAGKNLVVEKPFTVSSKEAELLVNLAEENNLKISVFQNRRWDSSFIKLKELIDNDSMGEISFYEAHYDRWRPNVQDRWREKDIAGSGILYDLGAHLIDQAVSLFGIPDSIVSDIQVQRNGAQAIDYFHLIFKYKKTRVILHSSCLDRVPAVHLRVNGSKSSFYQIGFDKQEELLMSGVKPRSEQWQALNQIESYLVTDQSEEVISISGNYEEFYEQMAEAILFDKKLPVEPRSSIEVIKIIEQISNSAVLM